MKCIYKNFFAQQSVMVPYLAIYSTSYYLLSVPVQETILT